jgi:hypothetical protein
MQISPFARRRQEEYLTLNLQVFNLQLVLQFYQLGEKLEAKTWIFEIL